MICISQYFSAFDGNSIERSRGADDGDDVTAASPSKSTNNGSEDTRPTTFHKMITMIFRTIFFMLRHDTGNDAPRASSSFGEESGEEDGRLSSFDGADIFPFCLAFSPQYLHKAI